MSKVTITCVLVKLLVVSCLAGTLQTIKTFSPPTTTTPLATATPGIITSSNVTAVGTDTSFSGIISSILKEIKRLSWAIISLMKDHKEIGRSISKGMCSSGYSMYSEVLKVSLKSLLEQLILAMKEELSDVRIPELPSYSNTYDEINDISEFKLKDLKVKGMENMMVSQYSYDLCRLTSSVEIQVPKLEITSTYTLIGNINGLPISGDGILNATINMIGANQQTFMECNIMLLKNDVCELTVKNRTVDLSTEKITVNMDNIKYGNQSISDINFGINDFVNNYMQTTRVNLIRKITELIEIYKQKFTPHRSPASFLVDLNRNLKELSIKFDGKQQSMSTGNASTIPTPWDELIGIFVNTVVQ